MKVTIRKATVGDQAALAELNAFVHRLHVNHNPSHFRQAKRATTRKEIGEMKKVMMAVAGLALGACMTAQAGYRTEATVTPGPEAHQYVVQFKITDVAKDGKADVVLAPELVVKAGEEGKMSVADEKGQVVDGDQLMAVIARSWAASGRLQQGCYPGSNRNRNREPTPTGSAPLASPAN